MSAAIPTGDELSARLARFLTQRDELLRAAEAAAARLESVDRLLLARVGVKPECELGELVRLRAAIATATHPA